MSTREEDIRMDCIRLAVEYIGRRETPAGRGNSDVIAEAARYYDFVWNGSFLVPFKVVEAGQDTVQAG